MELKSFDPKACTLTLGGVTSYGHAPDTKFNVSKTNGINTPTAGIDGDISVNLESRHLGTFSVSYLHNSSMVDTLSRWAYQVSEGSVTPFILLNMTDPSGSSIATYAWLETQPDYSVAQETGTLEYVFGVQDARLQPSNAEAFGSQLIQTASLL